MTALGIASGYDTSTTAFTSIAVSGATALNAISGISGVFSGDVHYLPSPLRPDDVLSQTGASTITRRGKQVVVVSFPVMSLTAYTYAINNYEGKVTVKTQVRGNDTYTEYNATCDISNYSEVRYMASVKWVFDVVFRFTIDGTASP